MTGHANELQLRYRSETRSTDVRLLDTGVFEADTYRSQGVELAGALGPVSVQGEFVWSDIARGRASDLRFEARYAQASWFITGERTPYDREKATFDSVAPRRSVVSGGPGAWKIGLRWSSADLNDGDILGGKEENLAIGLSWHLTPMLRLVLEHVSVRKLAGGPYDGSDPDIFQRRVQFAY